MTEAEWLVSDRPTHMLLILGERASERKTSLFWSTRPAWGNATTPKLETARGVWRSYGERGNMHPADDLADAMLIRELFGNPFRPVSFETTWLTAPITSLARSIYADRSFDRLPILADALEEAGCTNADILGHCRGPGPHVRGCWVVDLILGKS